LSRGRHTRDLHDGEVTDRTVDIADNLRRFSCDRSPMGRYASFDYCYNYFRAYHEDDAVDQIAADANVQGSCLQLGFYLASWGMLRGSSVLLQRSARHLVPVVEAIAQAPAFAWMIDADDYSLDVCDKLMDIRTSIRSAFPEQASDTLVTKIMLGVFGCVPAFDTNFKRGFEVWTLSRSSLRKVAEFYRDHAEVIEANRVPTLDFVSGQPTHRKYSRAKVIDMIFFVEGGRSQK
jgi:hypothetical protein